MVYITRVDTGFFKGGSKQAIDTLSSEHSLFSEAKEFTAYHLNMESILNPISVSSNISDFYKCEISITERL